MSLPLLSITFTASPPCAVPRSKTSLEKIQGWPEDTRSAALRLTRTVGTVDIASLKQSAPLLKRLLLFWGLVLVYVAFLTRTYYWDGVLFSLYIEKVHNAELPPSILFHPNH